MAAGFEAIAGPSDRDGLICLSVRATLYIEPPWLSRRGRLEQDLSFVGMDMNSTLDISLCSSRSTFDLQLE